MICNITRNTTIAATPCQARSWWMRTRGMIGRDFADTGFDAMVFEKCSSLHSCFMTGTLDVIFIDRNSKVVKTAPGFRPWQLLFGGKDAVTAIELPQGQIAATQTQTGDIIDLTMIKEQQSPDGIISDKSQTHAPVQQMTEQHLNQ